MLKSLSVVFALALLLAMIGDSAAKSQRPSPRNRESVEPPQTQSTQAKEGASQYPRGTAAGATPFVWVAIARLSGSVSDIRASPVRSSSADITSWWPRFSRSTAIVSARFFVRAPSQVCGQSGVLPGWRQAPIYTEVGGYSWPVPCPEGEVDGWPWPAGSRVTPA